MVAAEGLVVTPDAGGALSLLWLIPAVPLAVAFLNLFVGGRLGRWAGWLAPAVAAGPPSGPIREPPRGSVHRCGVAASCAGGTWHVAWLMADADG